MWAAAQLQKLPARTRVLIVEVQDGVPTVYIRDKFHH